MYYQRTEEYRFVCPKEFKAYCDFRDELRAAGITFHEEGGHTHQTIIIHTRGRFDNPGEIYSKQDV